MSLKDRENSWICVACFDLEIQLDQGKAGPFSKRRLQAWQSCFLEVNTMNAGYFNEFQVKSCIGFERVLKLFESRWILESF